MSASCTIRYAVSSTPVGSGVTAPSSVSVTGVPAARAVSTSSVSRSRPGCGSTRRLRVGVLTEDAEQPPHLGERVACGLADRAKCVLPLREGHQWSAVHLRLHRDRGDVVGDDVVQLPGDARPLAHGRLILECVDHRLTCLVAFGQRLASLSARVAERESGDDDQQEEDAGELRRRPP